MELKTHIGAVLLLLVIGCGGESDSETKRLQHASNPAREHKQDPPAAPPASAQGEEPVPKSSHSAMKIVRTIHVFVALCDNKSQGIVPVSKLLGNGDDPRNNLYWGAMYGTKTFLKRSRAWDVISATKGSGDPVLERIILKHRATGAYLVADAYRGARIKQAIEDFLNSAAGNNPNAIMAGPVPLGTHGMAKLVAYVGHNGLMDFNVQLPTRQANSSPAPAAIVLACKSKPYFQPTLKKLGCSPLLLTTGLMAPEAYTLHDALEAWLSSPNAANMRTSAAKAYNKYQKCGIRGATRLFHAE